jgi:hypothetical protein
VSSVSHRGGVGGAGGTLVAGRVADARGVAHALAVRQRAAVGVGPAGAAHRGIAQIAAAIVDTDTLAGYQPGAQGPRDDQRGVVRDAAAGHGARDRPNVILNGRRMREMRTQPAMK